MELNSCGDGVKFSAKSVESKERVGQEKFKFRFCRREKITNFFQPKYKYRFASLRAIKFTIAIIRFYY